VKKKTKARIKAQPKPTTVTVTLSSNDFGQMMDGLRGRLESWVYTAEYFATGETREDIAIEECSDLYEAKGMVMRYQKLIGELEAQSKPEAQGRLKLYTVADTESVAAVCAQFYSDRPRASSFYDRHCDELSGFPGVWNWVRDAALLLEKVSLPYGEPGEAYDWLEVVEDFGDHLLKCHNRALYTEAELRTLAEACFDANKY
jgi:hypothetical protein